MIQAVFSHLKTMSQQTQILDLLADGQKHCFTKELYMKDDRTRISELRKQGYEFNEGAGFCTDPTHHHISKVKLRQLLLRNLNGQLINES